MMVQLLAHVFMLSFAVFAVDSKKTSQITTQAELEQKRLLDAVKHGVVMIEVNAHLSLERGAKSNWLGSGFLVDKENGLIITNKHVAGDMAVCTYEVKFSTGVKVSAHFLYADPHYDIAFLRINPSKIPQECVALKFSKEEPFVHQEIYAMGNSAADEFSTYKGTVFSVYDNIGPFNEQSFRFSGMTVGGASGSPIFNKDGEVIGILYGGKFVSGAALPISYVKRALNFIQKKKIPPRHSIGAIFNYQDLDLVYEVGGLSKESVEKYKKEFPDAQNKILVVGTRLVNSPAARYFQAGDILWSVNGKMIGPRLKNLEDHIDGQKSVVFEIYRNGKIEKFSISTYEINANSALNFVSFGGCVWYTNHELQRMLTGEYKNGVYISSTDATSPLKEIFKNNMWASRPIRIMKIDNMNIYTLEDLKKSIKNVKNKKIFSIVYIDYLGETIFGEYVSADRQPRSVIVKYNNNFDTPKSFSYNTKTLEWDVESL